MITLKKYKFVFVNKNFGLREKCICANNDRLAFEYFEKKYLNEINTIEKTYICYRGF